MRMRHVYMHAYATAYKNCVRLTRLLTERRMNLQDL